jgi:hypothetical protein
MLAVIVSLWFALSACGKPEALTQVPAVPSSILEWPCKHPLITGGAVIGFALVAAGLYCGPITEGMKHHSVRITLFKG